MLLWLGVGLAIVAGGLTMRWFGRRSDSLGRAVGFPTWSVSLLVVAALGCWWPVYRHHQLEQRLSTAASQVVGFPVHVHCQTFGEAFVDAGAESGWVAFGADGALEHQTLLKQDICGALASFPSGGSQLTSEQVVAVHVLTHESMHMQGEADEAVAECRAKQRDALTAQALGASAEVGQELAWRYWMAVYPRMSEPYVSPDCVLAGALDEQLPDAPWSVKQ